MVQVHVPQGVGVRVPPWAPNPEREFVKTNSLFCFLRGRIRGQTKPEPLNMTFRPTLPLRRFPPYPACQAQSSHVEYRVLQAHVAELVDAHGSGPCAARCGGSSPSVGTKSGKGVRENELPFLFSARADSRPDQARAIEHDVPSHPAFTTLSAISCLPSPKLSRRISRSSSPRGGIGRRAWFRSMCRKVWGFESLRGHQA